VNVVSYDVEERRKAKMRSDDRILILKVIDNKVAISSSGMVDNRLFTGENTLHAIYDVRSGLWSMSYEMGILPGGLKQKFLSFSDLLEYARNYFKHRNIEIVEVID